MRRTPGAVDSDYTSLELVVRIGERVGDIIPFSNLPEISRSIFVEKPPALHTEYRGAHG